MPKNIVSIFFHLLRPALFGATLLVMSCLARAEDNSFEISIAPWPPISSDSTYGGMTKLSADLGYFLNPNIELQIGSLIGMRTKGTTDGLAGIYGGSLYNFSDDRLRSFIAGGGIGYVNHFPFVVYSPGDPSSIYVYLRGGKRFLLSKSYQITYFPYVELVYGFRTGDQHFGGQINIFNFSILF